MVRQENIEAASTVTSIIPASTVNCDHNSTIIITQNNQPEPIPSELINLYIGNILQKANNLANDQEPAITPKEAPKKAIGVIMAEANWLQKDKGQADTTTRSLSGNIQSQQEGLQQCISAQRVPDPCRSVEKPLELLNTCKLLNGLHLLMEKKNMMLLTAEWRRKHPPPPKQVPKAAPVASSSNSNVKKQPQAQNKGKGKTPATKPYSQGYRIPNIH
ncbi:hypothetical protein O181_104859 [Austropuccinia psidii MF-1]|uniref:Uncharacterized protein n=1 Tax=Austropuccinia psidii MF-1 TaxID=1389203 RepID=A0A9Q3PKK0_9BASI|nr:hypothetical protein [Austropuccinia psidii MF-1]